MNTAAPLQGISYRFRLRVRMAKGLTTEDSMRTFEFNGRAIDLKSQNPNEPLSETTWVVLGAGGFSTEVLARQFGEELRQAVTIAGLASRLGIDTGSDRATTWIDENFARSKGLIKQDERIGPNVHGLAVILDDGKTRFPLIKAKARVTADPGQVIGTIASLGSTPKFPPAVTEAIVILNMAIMATQPIAQLALALSTVEALGQNQTWTDTQRALIQELANTAEDSSAYDVKEREEVAEVMRRSLHRVGLRQGVVRVLDALRLTHLKHEWDRIYGVRSRLFHGIDLPAESEIAQLANEAITLCGTVVLTLAQREGLTLPEITATHFPELKRKTGGR